MRIASLARGPVAFVVLAFLVPLLPRPARAQGAGTLPQGESEWSLAYEHARQSDPAFKVESLGEFKRITTYYWDRLSDGTTRHSFQTVAGDSIQCVDIASQRSFVQSAPSGSVPPSAPGQPPKEIGIGSNHVESVEGIGKQFGLDGSIDEDGNSRGCQAGTFPKLMPTLSNLYRFRNLDEIFQKYPDGYRSLPPAAAGKAADFKRPQAFFSKIGTAPSNPSPNPFPASPPTGHEYAHAAEGANNIGSQADFNLWSPFVQQNDEFSLSQLWEAGGNYSDNTLQTVEFGWQVARRYGDSKAHLFIYSTSAAYTAGSGCYNLDCARFVQTNSAVVVGGSYTTYSSSGGTQYELPLMAYRDPSSQDWWLQYNGSWVGYYPQSLFNASGIANYASSIDFGGEIVNDDINGVHTATQMGSGHFSSAGYGIAAYIRQIQFWDLNGSLFNAGALTPVASNPQDYDITLTRSNDPNWLTNFFFGGPGNPSAVSPPNLTPYEPQGWSAPIVVTKQTGTTIDASPIAASDSLYVNWAVANNGTTPITQFFSTQLLVDGVLTQTWATNQPLQAGYYVDVKDYSIGSLSPGNHTLKLVADSGNVVSESNEGDNSYTKTITVSGSTHACVPGLQTLCLANGRFRVTATYQAPSGSGTGTAIPLVSDTGAFWFFSPSNYEVLVKVLNACANPFNHYWVFGGGLTNVQVTLTVTDTQTGAVKTYVNPQGVPFQPIQDTGAFATCP